MNDRAWAKGEESSPPCLEMLRLKFETPHPIIVM